MQKLMKSLIVAFAYMSMPIMAQKTDLVNPIIGTNGMGHTFSGVSIQQRTSRRSEDVKLFPISSSKKEALRSKSKWLFRLSEQTEP